MDDGCYTREVYDIEHPFSNFKAYIMITKFKEIWGKTDDIILRYPMVLTTALIAAISAVVAIEIEHQDNQLDRKSVV